jgi:hypothetical protein
MKDLTPAEQQLPGEAQGSDLLRLAIERDVDVEKLERLIQMRDRELLRQAQSEYDRAFAEMQKEYVPVHKDSSAKDGGGKVLYKYAPLETILKTYAPIWTEHGFSWTWEEKPVTISYDGKDHRGLEITCVVNGHGYEKRYPVQVEIPTPTKFTNAVQVTGVAKTYGRRYSLIDAFSPIIEDEDDDARSLTVDDGLEYADQIKALRRCTSIDQLKAAAKEEHDKLKESGDSRGVEILLTEFRRLKSVIEKAESEAAHG